MKKTKVAIAGLLAMFLGLVAVNAKTNFTFEGFTTGSDYGTKTKVSDTVVNLKGNEEASGGMFVGPFNKESKATLADGITEEVNIEIDPSSMAQGELFEVSLALKNKGNEYVTEYVAMAQKDGEVVNITTSKENFKVAISEQGIYTYQWKMYKESEKTYVEFAVLSGAKVLGTTGKIDFDTVTGPATKNPIASEEEVDVKYLWFCNIQVEDGINVYLTLPEPAITFTTPETDMTEEEKAIAATLTASLKADELYQNLNPADQVVIDIEMDEIEVDQATQTRFEEAVADFADEITILDYYDISVVVRNAQGTEIGTISELTEDVIIEIDMPTDLPEVAEGLERRFYILREHDNEIEYLDVLPVEATTDTVAKLRFESDKYFSICR